MFCHWAKIRYRHIPDTYLVYLHFISYHGVAPYYLHDYGFLAEYQKVHTFSQAKPAEISVKNPMPGDKN